MTQATAETLPVPRDAARERKLADLDRLARLLDTKWRVPGLGWRFGLDGVAGLVPVVGDVATAGVSAWIILQAARLGAPRELIGRMVANVALDTAVGAVPILGGIFDFFFKANNRNMAMLRRHLEAA